MEFKDRLKKLRIEKHVSQQELANSIYVSRSAIAKWENGLGLPNETSYKALLTFFNVSREEFPLNEETENISIAKNKKIPKTPLKSAQKCYIIKRINIPSVTIRAGK